MMKLEFEQVLEYVRDGEQDPRIEKLLQTDPDGPAMLREARLMFEVLGEQPEPPESPPVSDAFKMLSASADAAKIERPASKEPLVASSRETADLFGDESGSQFTPSDAKSMSLLAKRAAGPKREIGELRIRRGERTASLSYDPKPGLPKLKRPQLRDAAAEPVTYYQSEPRKRVTDIKIKGYGLTIKLPEDVPADGRLTIKITDTQLRAPARGLDLIFMPETGPFAKGRTDSKGVAEFEIPEQSGILRINGDPPQVLRIRVEKK